MKYPSSRWHRTHGISGAGGGMSRRQWLQGAGLAATALPLVGRSARAQAAQPLRLICWPMFNGAEAGRFYPGGGDASALSGITEPLRKYANLVSFIRNVNISGSVNHYAIRSMYTGGNVSTYTSPNPTVASIDQLIANHLGPDRPHAGQVAAPGGDPGRLAERLPPGPVDGVLRPRAGRLRGQSGHRLRSPVRPGGRGAGAGPSPGVSRWTQPSTPPICWTPRWTIWVVD